MEKRVTIDLGEFESLKLGVEDVASYKVADEILLIELKRLGIEVSDRIKLALGQTVAPKSSNNAPQSKTTSPNTTHQKTDKMVTVRLTDGDITTKQANEDFRLGHLGWKWNDPEKSYDWNKRMTEKEWNAVKEQEPFNQLKAKIVEE